MEQKRLAFVFPARVMRFKGLGEDFFKSYPEIEALSHEADLFFNKEISQLCLNGFDYIAHPDSKIFFSTHVINCFFFTLLKTHNIKPKILLGSSLGIYASLFASESISFKESNILIKTAIHSISQDSNKKACAEILGLNQKSLTSIIENYLPKDSVFISHFNAPNQFIISGDEPSVRKVIELSIASGGFSPSVILTDHLIQTSSLKLSPLLKETIFALGFKDPKIPICSDTDAKLLSSGEEIQMVLMDHLTKPVLFEKSIKLLIAEGINSFIEVGVGGVLSKLIRWIDRKVRTHCVQDKPSFEKALKLFG